MDPSKTLTETLHGLLACLVHDTEAASTNGGAKAATTLPSPGKKGSVPPSPMGKPSKPPRTSRGKRTKEEADIPSGDGHDGAASLTSPPTLLSIIEGLSPYCPSHPDVPINAARYAALWHLLVPEGIYPLLTIDAPATQPLRDDAAFIVAEEAWSVMRAWEIQASTLSISTAQKLLDTAKVTMMDAVTLISRCTKAVREYVTARTKAMTTAPRALQLCRRLHLNEIESAALVHVLILHCGTYAPMAQGLSLSPNAVARAVRMSSDELVEFVKEHRAHIKQGVLTFCETRLKVSLNEMRFKMSLEVVSALCGASLTEEQLIKLERTALCDVVRESLEASPPPGRLPPRSEAGRNAAVAGASAGATTDGDGSGTRRSLDDIRPGQLSTEALLEMTAHMLGDADDSSSSSGDDDGAGGAERKPKFRPPPQSPGANAMAIDKMSLPYTTDLEYMDEQFKALATVIKLRNAEADVKDEEDDYYNPKNKAEASLRELRGRERVQQAIITSRMETTRKLAWRPKAEALAERLGLTDTERRILLMLVGNVVSHDILIAVNGRYVMRGDGQREFTVGYLLFVLLSTLDERVASRRCFYQTSPLVKHGLVTVSSPATGRNVFNTDLADYLVDVDRRIVDHLMGLDTEPSEMVQGSKVYAPHVPLSHVVLPSETTTAVLSTISHYALFASCKKKCGFNELAGENSIAGGLVLLFYGPSGTGKTMLANAIAHHLKKKVLLVNAQHFKQLSGAQGSDVMRFIFREARLSDAVVFFDECETIFETREANPLLTSILPEFERYDGVVILATNRASQIDEAMNRRISMMVEFTLPDHEMRERIWRAHVPTQLKIADDVNIETVALDYELSGGLIKNAMLAALSSAVARENTDVPTLTMQDLVSGAKTQMRGLFQAADSAAVKNHTAYVTPRRRLEDMVLGEDIRKQLEQIVKLTKSRHTLYAQWGFDQRESESQNAVVLVHGPSGTGKSLCAEAIAFECGLTLRVANTAALAQARDPSAEIQKVFEEARTMGAAVVFDSSQCLFELNDSAAQLAQQIQFYANTCTKPVIVLAQTDRSSGAAGADPRACKMRFTDEIAFALPAKTLRRRLWEAFLPAKVPRAPSGIDFDVLSQAAGVSARQIKTVCFAACAKVALRCTGERFVSTDDLLTELRWQQEIDRRRSAPTSMFV
jgi:SpoVK/Ycf46/Vps4 family AAA+-type ATPase